MKKIALVACVSMLLATGLALSQGRSTRQSDKYRVCCSASR